MKKGNKKLFKGSFNFQGEVIILWTYSKNKEGAFKNFIAKLVKIVKFSRYSIFNYFNGEKDNYFIEEVEDGL